ncbi:MAG: hydrolase 2, exosortase A system-associated [Pseudomonadales bacterium]|nr:hydrolase 2, exosortase A system-associated [Pseudomonadales bacterium]
MSKPSLAAPVPEALFLPGNHGNLFALYQPAMGTIKGTFLYIPPFAEEMNRCRATVSRQTREFAKIGYSTLVLDLFGTGDSEGELSDASWNIWQNDIEIAVSWLEEKTHLPVSIWGFRLGALLAADFANRSPKRVNKLLFWQPVLEGKLFLTQYLRFRVAFLMDRNMPPETTKEIREQLVSGDIVEVAGYPLSGALTNGMDGNKISSYTQLTNQNISWFERVADAEKPLSPPSVRLIKQLQDLGCKVNAQKFSDPQVWQLHDKDETPNLIAATTQLFRDQDEN